MPELSVKSEQDLLIVAAKDPSLYKDESLAALTLYTLLWLQNWELMRTIEAVSILNWRLFPRKFSMVGFEQFPDAFRTNRSLLQGQPKYRNWLTGRAKEGYSLNERGFQIALQLNEKLGSPSSATGDAGVISLPKALVRAAKTVQARTIEPERQVSRIRSSRIFTKWKEGPLLDRDIVHLYTLLEVFDHTPAKVKNKRLKDFERCAQVIADDEINRFLNDLRITFAKVFAAN